MSAVRSWWGADEDGEGNLKVSPIDFLHDRYLRLLLRWCICERHGNRKSRN